MTATQIEKAQTVANLPYSLAIQIRSLLDSAKAEHGKTVGASEDWDELESKVFELLAEED